MKWHKHVFNLVSQSSRIVLLLSVPVTGLNHLFQKERTIHSKKRGIMVTKFSDNCFIRSDTSYNIKWIGHA